MKVGRKPYCMQAYEYFKQAEILIDQNDIDNAITMYHKAITTMRREKELLPADFSDLDAYFNNLALAYESKGEFKKAISMFTYAAHALKDAYYNDDDKKRCISGYTKVIGDLYYKLQNVAGAIACYESVAGCLLELEDADDNDRRHMAQSEHALAAAYLVNGNAEKAYMAHFRVLMYLETIESPDDKDIYLQAITYGRIAKLFFDAEVYTKAIKFYQLAISKCSEISKLNDKHYRYMGSLHANSAKAYEQRGVEGDDNKALMSYAHAIEALDHILVKTENDMNSVQSIADRNAKLVQAMLPKQAAADKPKLNLVSDNSATMFSSNKKLRKSEAQRLQEESQEFLARHRNR